MKLILIIILIAVILKYYYSLQWKDFIDPKRYRAVLVWILKRSLRLLGENTVYLTKNELLQYTFRTAQCTNCLIEGRCENCGCDAEGRLNGITDECSLKKWGPFLSDDEMKVFLENNDIIIDFKLKEK